MVPMSTHDPIAGPINQLQEMENRLIELDRQVQEMRAEVARWQALIRPRMPWRTWLRHQIKLSLGLLTELGQLTFPDPPRALRVPARYHRQPALTDPPLISVVTPSYNQGRFLERTIRSVLEQQYPRLQYVVQDGGSKDETAQVLDKYRAQLHHCEMRKDNGQSHAINLGFAHTTGEIMAYLNSDDLLLPGALFAVAKYFEEHPDVDVVYGHRVVINRHGDELGRWVLPPHDAEAIKWADYIPQETLFWRRRIWDRVGGIDESFRFAMDWDLILRFQDAGAKFHRLGRFLGAFRVHNDSKTVTTVESTGTDEMAILRYRCHGRDVSPTEIKDALRKYFWRHVLCNRFYRLGLFRY
jgi:glycosyltransferase involved in cell wall biosynthesis